MPKRRGDRERLYLRAQAANVAHKVAFDRYLSMLTGGQDYSEDALTKQLALADAALSRAQRAARAWEQAEQRES